jgi:hypothetical protein
MNHPSGADGKHDAVMGCSFAPLYVDFAVFEPLVAAVAQQAVV